MEVIIEQLLQECAKLKEENNKLKSQLDEVKTAWGELKNSIVDPATGFTYYEVFDYDFNKLDKILSKLEGVGK